MQSKKLIFIQQFKKDLFVQKSNFVKCIKMFKSLIATIMRCCCIGQETGTEKSRMSPYCKYILLCNECILISNYHIRSKLLTEYYWVKHSYLYMGLILSQQVSIIGATERNHAIFHSIFILNMHSQSSITFNMHSNCQSKKFLLT